MTAKKINSAIRTVMQIALIAYAPFSASAQSGNPAWTDDFSAQLAVSEQCEVAFFTNLNETTKKGLPHYSARAHCVDGRQFDGERTGDNDPFEIRTCNVSTC